MRDFLTGLVLLVFASLAGLLLVIGVRIDQSVLNSEIARIGAAVSDGIVLLTRIVAATVLLPGLGFLLARIGRIRTAWMDAQTRRHTIEPGFAQWIEREDRHGNPYMVLIIPASNQRVHTMDVPTVSAQRTEPRILELGDSSHGSKSHSTDQQ